MSVLRLALNHITKRDAVCLLELIHESLSCFEGEDFRELMDRLGELIPYDFAVSAYATIDSGGVKNQEVLNVSYPDEWLALYAERQYERVDPIIREQLLTTTPQRWTDTYRQLPPPKEFLSLSEDFGLKEGYTHGRRNRTGTEGSLYSFSGNSLGSESRIKTILELVIPHLHQTFIRMKKLRKAREIPPLSQREKEVLKWVGHGKSAWDISVILGISERTVNFHVNNIMQKLDVVSRAQAVAVAVELDLLDLE